MLVSMTNRILILLLFVNEVVFAGYTSDHVMSRKIFFYSIPLAVLLVIIYRKINKSSDGFAVFICPSCEHQEPSLNVSESHNCPKCGEEMVKLEGFYDGREK